MYFVSDIQKSDWVLHRIDNLMQSQFVCYVRRRETERIYEMDMMKVKKRPTKG